ncbi:MAG: thioredoxin domain-containing protein [Aggregatilineales bacterium]
MNILKIWIVLISLPTLMLTSCGMITGMLRGDLNAPEPEPTIEIRVPIEVPEVYATIPQSVTESGFPVLGDLNAPVEVMLFSSFSCPGCEQYHREIFPEILPYIQRGDVRFIFVPQLTGSLTGAERAARAALCAGNQGKFYEFGDILFQFHRNYDNLAFVNENINEAVAVLNLDSDAWRACFGGDDVAETIADSLAFGWTLEVLGTPTTFVNDLMLYSPFEILYEIDEALANSD